MDGENEESGETPVNEEIKARSQTSQEEKSSGGNKVNYESSKDSSLNEDKKTAEDFEAEGVTLSVDSFGKFFDEQGKRHFVKRFTWTNRNKIQIQVINYGARVISIKLPDRKGEIEDILLGFDDIGGYLFYDKYYFGAAIGRVSNVIKNSSFTINNKRYSVNSNMTPHCQNGGFKGLDKVLFETYTKGKKVIMSHLSPHLTEGFPGDLLVYVTFELSAKNEFRVNFEAQCTKPTCVDLSHLLYFNLAGHHRGPDEIYRHILTLNCNCYTPQVNKIPTGEILNVIHTEFDFQIPKILGKVIGVTPKDGFQQNLCVNRGMYQGDCFVGRILHPPSGRMLEIYSNQPGVQLDTANDFGYGHVLSMEDIISDSKAKAPTTKLDSAMLIFQKVHTRIADLLKIDEEKNFDEIKQLISKFKSLKAQTSAEILSQLGEEGFLVTPMQFEYLKKAQEVICENDETDDPCLDLKEALDRILNVAKVKEPSINDRESSGSKEKVSSPRSSVEISTSAGPVQSGANSKTNSVSSSETNNKRRSSLLRALFESESEKEDSQKKEESNKIPCYYENVDQIRGKSRALYRMHGAISLKSQNYPNAINLKHFPKSVLNPGEVYKHDVVYRFWIRAGNPNKWIKRNLAQNKHKAKS